MVIRYEGPKGGPGMREMLERDCRHRRRRLGRERGADHRRTFQRRNPRFDGRATSLQKPRWAGRLPAIREGDMINIDVNKRVLEVEISDQVLKQRLSEWRQPAPRYQTGVFAKYAALVSSASQGAITTPR